MHLLEQEPQPQDKEYRTIQLTKGQIARVDVDDYERLTEWKWRAVWNKATESYYALRSLRVNGKRPRAYLHRVVMGEPIGIVDHRNHDTLDNRKENLRVVTPSQNQQNKRMGVRNKIGLKGVSWHKACRKWRADIGLDGRQISLGLFSTPEAAHLAYVEAVRKYHGEYGCLETKPSVAIDWSGDGERKGK
jgi:hypothetical protein